MEKTKEEIIEEMQAVAHQMVLDDLEENSTKNTKVFEGKVNLMPVQ